MQGTINTHRNSAHRNFLTDIHHTGWWIFIFAVFVRLVYFAWSQSSPYLYHANTDEAFYIDYARALISGKHYVYDNFMDPMLSWLLVLPMSLTDNLYLARFGMLLLDSVNAVLMYALCLMYTRNRLAACVCGVLYALYSMTLTYSVFLTKVTPVITLLLLIVYCFFYAIRNKQKWGFLLAGFASALLFFLGAGFLLLILAYVILLFFFRECRQGAFWYLAGIVVMLTTCLLTCRIIDPQKSLMPTNGGIVFYIANHADNPWGTHYHPAFVKEATPTGIYHAFREEAQHRDATIITDQQVSLYWYKQTLNENLQQPGMALQRLLHKWLLLMSNDEISQNYYLPYIRQETLKGMPLPGFALVLGFGLTGLLLLARRDIYTLLLVMPIAVTFLIGSLFFVSSRMRLPMVPFLVIGVSLWFSVNYFTNYHVKALVLALLLVFASYGIQLFTTKPPSPYSKYALAVTMVHARMFNEADVLLDQALKEKRVGKYLALKALVKSYQGKCTEALPLYDEALELDASLTEARENRKICEHYLQSQ